MRTDVVVVGLGAFGSGALWRLAERGVRVVGVERHGIGHEQGSSHGLTRLFRIACMEHPGLAKIALKSLELWRELGARTGAELVSQTGCLNVGPPDSRPVRGAVAAAEAANVPVQLLSHEELVARQPQYADLAPEDVAVWDPGAGLCYPERNVRAQVKAARERGAEVWTETPVERIEVGDGVIVHTPTAELHARQVVVTAGKDLGTLLPQLPVTPRPTPLTWFQPKDPEDDAFTLERFPAFIWHRADGEGLWGHGSGADFKIKLGLERAHSTDQDAAVDELAEAVAASLPGLDPRPVEVVPCVVTDSPDGQFLVGRLNERRVVVAGGDSGHGFKHAAGIGELLAQIVTGERTYCRTDFLDPTRFS